MKRLTKNDYTKSLQELLNSYITQNISTEILVEKYLSTNPEIFADIIPKHLEDFSPNNPSVQGTISALYSVYKPLNNYSIENAKQDDYILTKNIKSSKSNRLVIIYDHLNKILNKFTTEYICNASLELVDNYTPVSYSKYSKPFIRNDKKLLSYNNNNTIIDTLVNDIMFEINNYASEDFNIYLSQEIQNMLKLSFIYLFIYNNYALHNLILNMRKDNRWLIAQITDLNKTLEQQLHISKLYYDVLESFKRECTNPFITLDKNSNLILFDTPSTLEPKNMFIEIIESCIKLAAEKLETKVIIIERNKLYNYVHTKY